MVETKTLSTLLVILVATTSFIMIVLMGINSWYFNPSESAFAITFFLVQIELILITILLVRFPSSTEETQSES